MPNGAQVQNIIIDVAMLTHANEPDIKPIYRKVWHVSLDIKENE